MSTQATAQVVQLRQGEPVPASHITCDVCGRGRVSRIGGTRNATHRHFAPGSRFWCYGPGRSDAQRDVARVRDLWNAEARATEQGPWMADATADLHATKMGFAALALITWEREVKKGEHVDGAGGRIAALINEATAIRTA